MLWLSSMKSKLPCSYMVSAVVFSLTMYMVTLSIAGLPRKYLSLARSSISFCCFHDAKRNGPLVTILPGWVQRLSYFSMISWRCG